MLTHHSRGLNVMSLHAACSGLLGWAYSTTDN